MDRINELLSKDYLTFDEYMELREMGYEGEINVSVDSLVPIDFGVRQFDEEALDIVMSDRQAVLFFGGAD